MGVDVESRIRRLEWTNRFLIVISLAALGSSALGRVNAQGPVKKIVADSIETRSLKIDDPAYGKQSIEMDAGDDGMVGLTMTDVNGEATVDIGSVNPVGEPGICLNFRNVCRVAIGSVQPGRQPEFSVQLRDKRGSPIWMPPVANPYTPSGWTPTPVEPHAPPSK